MSQRLSTCMRSVATLITAGAVVGIALTSCGSYANPGTAPSAVSGSSGTGSSSTNASNSHFVVVSASFVSPDQGFVLGESCPNGSCDAILETTDRGRSWTRLSLPEGDVEGGLGALEPTDHIYFADLNNGWIFADFKTFATHDGGAHWSAIAMQSVQLISAGAGRAYLVGVACPSLTGNCSGNYALYRSALGSDQWTVVPGVTPQGPEGLSVSGSAVFVTGNSRFAWSPDGSSFSELPDPCSPTATIGRTVPLLISAWSATTFGVVCAAEPTNDNTEVRDVFVTQNDGRSYKKLSSSGSDGIVATITLAGPSTVLLVTLSPAADRLFRMTQAGSTTVPLTFAGGLVSDLHMADASNGGLVGTANTGTVRQGGFSGTAFSGRLYLTHDGGRTWRAATITP